MTNSNQSKLVKCILCCSFAFDRANDANNSREQFARTFAFAWVWILRPKLLHERLCELFVWIVCVSVKRP